ncbi:bacteriohemerythrin [Azomonas macrocytogenes]|uniref:Hemerythrin n=1 Tax=Azomonas macrocytogenes TaxID=69962 RepID=A0A839T160_AZOMA|nr:bacteriohemerythrin [Azomonas macrocytogenes]MBB3102310.1 hemerythrin [Azomonas macrocytogenes]
MGFEIEWSPDFETGIEIIDGQHKRLFEYFREVDNSIASGDENKVGEVAMGLIDYAISHNAFEETLMKQAEYPHLEAHRKIHAAFAERVRGYARKLEEGADPVKVARTIRIHIGLWLIDHIKREDRNYVSCVKKSLDPGFVARMMSKVFG